MFIVSVFCYILIEGLAFRLSVLYACLICINFNKYIYTLIKQIFDGSPSHTLYILLNAGLSICVCAYIFMLLVLSLYWVLDISGRS